MDAKTTLYTAISATTLLFSGSAQADVTEDVRCREIAFSQSVEEQDAVAFASFIDADARFVSSGVSRGVDEVVTAWTPFLTAGGPTIKWRPQLVEVLQEGNLALSRGPFRLTVTSEDGVTTEHWGTFNSVWRLADDGTWKVVFDAGSSGPETPTDEHRQLLDAENNECPPGKQ